MNKTYKDFGSAKHQNRCADLENASTSAFLDYCKKNGFTVRKASQNQDKFQHVDFIVTINGREIAVDVKGKKRFSENGFLLVEILNVAGNRGWLLGKADVIAFETENGFFFVWRYDIFNLLKNRMGLVITTRGGINVSVTNGRRVDTLPCFAPAWYSRPDRPREMVTYVEMKDFQKAGFSLAGVAFS